MTLQEVTDIIIEELYNRRSTITNVKISEFCKEIGLIINQEMRHVIQKLERDDYVTINKTTSVDGIISLNSKGVDYIEKKLEEKNKINNTNNEHIYLNFEDNKYKINQDKSETLVDNKRTSIKAIAEINRNNVEPCFGIEQTASLFADHIDNIDNKQT